MATGSGKRQFECIHFSRAEEDGLTWESQSVGQPGEIYSFPTHKVSKKRMHLQTDLDRMRVQRGSLRLHKLGTFGISKACWACHLFYDLRLLKLLRYYAVPWSKQKFLRRLQSESYLPLGSTCLKSRLNELPRPRCVIVPPLEKIFLPGIDEAIFNYVRMGGLKETERTRLGPSSRTAIHAGWSCQHPHHRGGDAATPGAMSAQQHWFKASAMGSMRSACSTAGQLLGT